MQFTGIQTFIFLQSFLCIEVKGRHTLSSCLPRSETYLTCERNWLMKQLSIEDLRVKVVEKVMKEDDPAILEEILQLFILTGVEEPTEPYLISAQEIAEEWEENCEPDRPSDNNHSNC